MVALITFTRRILLLATLALSAQAQATIVYNSWTSNEPPSANYIFTVDHVGNQFSYNLTVTPWNAEALGVFIDLGNVLIGTVGLTDINPSNQVALYAQDAVANGNTYDCGLGCNLQVNQLPALIGNDWELVFRLGSQGFDGIQTFSWKTNDFGLSLTDFGLVGIRAQQQCSGNNTIPSTTSAGNCDGSDKSYGYGSTLEIPEPNALALFSLALLSLLALKGRRLL